MKIKFWLVFLAISFTMFEPQVWAKQISPESTTPRRILLSMDTLFKPASNSDGFLVVKSSDLEILKKQIQEQFDLLESKANETSKLVNDNTPVTPSTQIENTVSSGEVLSIKNQEGGFDQLYVIIIGFFIVSCLILIVVYYSNLKKVKESKIRLADLENEFSDYKSTMIERERKLMRDLIDARNKEE